METQTLIDRCAVICHGRSELARRIEARPQQITDWAAGTKPVPLAKRLALCDLAGLTPQETLAHLREVAGVQGPKMKAILTGFALVVGLFTVGGVAQPAEAHGKLLRIVDNVYYVYSSTSGCRPIGDFLGR